MTNARICLAMMVKNEEAVLPRALESVAPHVSAWCIVDTGSEDTDQLAKISEHLLAEIPGVFTAVAWTGFQHTRTATMRLAQAVAASHNCDWILTLDADATATLQPGWREQLEAFAADAALLEFASATKYRLPWLMRAGKPWRYRGAVHEYLDCDSGYSREPFDGITLFDHNDGAGAPIRVARNLSILRDEWRRDQTDPRTAFYLAQSLRDAGQFVEAIGMYRIRATMDGPEEEAWWSMYQAGVLLADQGEPDLDAALLALGWAYERRRHRAGPLYHMARLSRLRGQYGLAHMYAQQAYSIPVPTSETLFVERWVYEWCVPFEYVDSCWRLGDFGTARLILPMLERMALPTGYPEHLRIIRNAVGSY